MNNSIAFVQHSIIANDGDSEGTPVSVLEAQASSLPVIATIHGGIPDVVINGKTGILVKEMDIEGMAAAMIELINNKELAKQMGNLGRQRIKDNFSMETHLNKLNQCIASSISKNQIGN
jgi:glycosyltransferase involved in cell wall biosynthesis